MAVKSTQQVTLNVHLGGVIAYVPDGKTLWALMPNALMPTPAQWAETKERKVLRAHASHMALLLLKEDQIDKAASDGRVKSVISPWKKSPKDWKKYAKERKAAVTLVAESLEFLVKGEALKCDPKVKEFVPAMAVIAPDHKKVSRKFLPTDPNTDWRGLSAAFSMETGTLTVEDYFGKPKKPENVDFAIITVNSAGELEFKNRVWRKWIANRLLWTVKLPLGERSVTIKNIEWAQTQKKNRLGTRKFVLKPSADNNTIDVWIMHSEVEVPTLYLPDPIYPKGVRGLPDPDFEIFYRLSTNQDAQLPRKFPVPPLSGPVGTKEKPCSGGFFEEFA